jgi:hypothetical protein
MGASGAGAAQAQVMVAPYVNVTVGAPLASGVYGQIQFTSGVPVPPLYASMPVMIGHPIAYAQPVYLYVPDRHRLNWRRYCLRYNACRQPVYFVNAAAIRRRPVVVNHPVVMPPHRDNGRHGGWHKHRKDQNGHDANHHRRWDGRPADGQ